MFIDSHCHLNFACFDSQRKILLRTLQQIEIKKLIIPATHSGDWSSIQKLCKHDSSLYYALGYHPHFLEYYQDDDLLCLDQLLKNRDKQCIALGEIGLDKFAKVDISIQEEIFIKQLKIAQKLKLPIILHVVKKQGRALQILKEQHFSQGGVYHGFSGSEEIALAFIALGFKIGVGGVITYPNARKTKQTMSLLPIESLILETDAPDMPIYQQQHKDNSPLNLINIFDSLAELRSEPKSCLASQLYQNTVSIFSLNND